MPISATGDKRSRGNERGFTLVELMIVLALFGLMSAVVILAMPDPRGRIRHDAERFAARVLAVRDRAIIDGRDTRVMIDPLGYDFAERRGEKWQPINAKPFEGAQWEQGTRITVGRDGRGAIMFDNTGLASEAIAVELRREGAAIAVQISQNGAVRVGN